MSDGADKYGENTAATPDIPIDVLQRLASQAKDAADFERLKQQWLAAQGQLKAIADVVAQHPNLIQLSDTQWYDPLSQHVWTLSGTQDKPGLTEQPDKESATILRNLGINVNSLSGGAPGPGQPGTGGVTTDPRYWDIQYKQLYQNALNMGLDAESARRQALATLITNRNNTQLGIAQTSADVAKQAAEFAANPRDTYAEALYRGQVGGSTPFGDLNNPAFGEYEKALAEKAASIFAPVNKDLQTVRDSAAQWPQPDFVNPAPAIKPVLGYAKGGTIDIGNPVRFGDLQPSSSEGGTNMNIHEPAVVMGIKSKHVYATLAEGGYPEQLIIKPTPSGKKAAMEAEKAHKSMQGMMSGAKPMATGGSATIDDMNAAFQKLLERLGGEGGGSTTPLGGTRFLAGSPANAIANDPFLRGITEASYSMKGISPDQLWADIRKFTPNAPMNNIPRLNFA